MTPATLTAAADPIVGSAPESAPKVETMEVPELAGYLSAVVRLARIDLQLGLTASALRILADASDALDRRTAALLGKWGDA